MTHEFSSHTHTHTSSFFSRETIIFLIAFLLGSFLFIAVAVQGASVIGSALGGIGTTTPWKSSFAIEQNGANPSFVVGDTGTSTPLFFISANGRIGIGTSSPGALFAIDTTTVAHPARNLFYIGSSTANNFVVDNHGNIGIGTASPAERLHIEPSSGEANIRLKGSAARLRMFENDNTDENFEWVVNNGNLFVNELTDAVVFVKTPFLIEGTTGNVGIGTTTPAEKFSLNGGAFFNSDLIRISSSSAASLTIKYQSAATSTIKNLIPNAFAIATSTTNTPIFTISTKSSRFGLVGIGTTSPASTLSIESSSSATSTIHLGARGSTTNGSCLQMYDAGGTAYRIYITKASTTILAAEQGSCE